MSDNSNELRVVFEDTASISHWAWIQDQEESWDQYPGCARFEPLPTETVKRLRFDNPIRVTASYLPCKGLGIIELTIPEEVEGVAGLFDSFICEKTTRAKLIRNAIEMFDRAVRMVNSHSPVSGDLEGQQRAIGSDFPEKKQPEVTEEGLPS